MSEQEIGIANGWEDLDKDARSSTVAFFVGGAKCVLDVTEAEEGDEVLIWHGVSELVEDGDDMKQVTVFEGYDKPEVPDGSTHLIVTKKHNQKRPINSRFGSSIDEAKDIAREEVSKLSNGTY